MSAPTHLQREECFRPPRQGPTQGLPQGRRLDPGGPGRAGRPERAACRTWSAACTRRCAAAPRSCSRRRWGFRRGIMRRSWLRPLLWHPRLCWDSPPAPRCRWWAVSASQRSWRARAPRWRGAGAAAGRRAGHRQDRCWTTMLTCQAMLARSIPTQASPSDLPRARILLPAPASWFLHLPTPRGSRGYQAATGPPPCSPA
jgi:hypothetical protein